MSSVGSGGAEPSGVEGMTSLGKHQLQPENAQGTEAGVEARQARRLWGAVFQLRGSSPQKSVISSCSSQLQNNKIVKNPII